jgi:hypothetical protein
MVQNHPIRDRELTDPIQFKRPINWRRLRADEAERIIRERVKDTGNVQISKHAYDRLEQRSGVQAIFAEDVYDIRETGAVQSAPILEDGSGKSFSSSGCRGVETRGP